MVVGRITDGVNQIDSSTNSSVQKKWTQIKNFVKDNRKEVLVAMLIVGIAILAISVGGSIAVAYAGSITKLTYDPRFPWAVTGVLLAEGGYYLIHSLISAIFGAAIAAFAAGGLAGSKK